MKNVAASPSRRRIMPARGRRYVQVGITFAVGILVVPLLRAFQLDVARPAAATLAPLEARLAADPDNLQLGSQYRKAVITYQEYDRAIEFFQKLVASHPNGANTRLNYGFSYVDKVPAAGSITQVILANNALGEFSKSIELRPTWIGLYTRGNSYLYWPKIFGRASLAVADLEQVMKMQKADSKRAYHVRAYVALGDGYWKMDDLDKARAIWSEGLRLFPGNPQLTARLAKSGDDLKAIMDAAYDITKRIDTSLEELWAE
jgi:tetratricopeptide (TPR) repeat protein